MVDSEKFNPAENEMIAGHFGGKVDAYGRWLAARALAVGEEGGPPNDDTQPAPDITHQGEK